MATARPRRTDKLKARPGLPPIAEEPVEPGADRRGGELDQPAVQHDGRWNREGEDRGGEGRVEPGVPAQRGASSGPGSDGIFAPPFPNVLPDLAHSMKMNPGLGVLVQQGYYDLATPHFVMEYVVNHMDLDAEQRERIEIENFSARAMRSSASRSGSTDTKTTCTPSAADDSRRRFTTAAIVARVVGHTSGQNV